MLLGSLLVRGNNHCIYQFDVSGVDSSSAMSLHLYARSYNAMQFMCNPEANEDDSYLDDRAVTIGIGKVSVQTKKYIDENGKSKKCAVNSDLFCRLAALVRYVKSHCFVQNEEGYTGLMLASGEFEISTSTKYIIPFEMKKEILATVTLCFGAVTNLHIKTDDFELRLDEDENAQQELFPQIKDAWTSGIKLNEEYLGFPLKPIKIEEVQSNNGMYTCIEDIVKAHPEKELSWLLKRDYRIVDDDNLEEICNYIMNWDGYVYYDTETTGLNINFKSREGQADQCVGVVLSVKDGESFYFPMQMKAIKNLCGGDHYYFMERYMRPILEGKKLVAHNMSFDWKVAYIYDINANIVADTMAIIRLTLGAAKSNYPMGLKENAKLLLHRDSLELSDLVIDNSWGESDIKFWDLPYELVRLYACADTDNTKGLHDYAINTDLLNQYNARKINEIEVAFSFAVAYQEFYGHRIDVRNMEQVRKEVGAEQDKYMKLMVDLVGHEFNPNSPKQLQQVMYDELEYPKQISRKSGRVSTDKEALQKLAEITDIEDNIKYPFCKWLLKYREAEGVRKIIDKFPEHATEDGYVFSSVMQYGTETGRVSINKPNYQSYNDPIKKNVIPRPGFWAFDTDYSSVEYRVLGNMVRNKNIMENFKDPDFDYHTYQAAHMYGVPYASVTKKLRKAAKGINFGLPYGMGDESLGVRVFGEATAENTRKAASLRTAYFKGQEDIRDWFEYHRDRGVHEGFTETYFGRRRYYDKSKFSDGAIRRQAGNQVIQGCMGGDTRIQTKEFGIMKLKDLVDLNVLVWNGTEWSNGDVLYSGKKPKCIVRFKGGQEIICSPQHKFLVIDTHGKEHWVEAQDLKFGYKSSANNSHVRVNDNYAPSDYEYSSEDAYKYRTSNHQSNNAFLEDITRAFDRGVMLGRLASDGSYCVRNDGGSYVTNFVAEHEYNILSELRTCMESLGYTESEPEVREGRKEKVKRLSVYSSSLANEITDLDIKHKVHDNIFMDTEMLRGFISGFFDGDGGISGKTITLVFGVQYDFEELCLDLQKALLFFGVRSRYRKYDDRYVIQIKTNDNDKFLDVIGFLNQEKQDKGRALTCIEKETTFGKCIVVDSVEVTDELIDMYDVCNTDEGYYVADGIITHNTAADIYKTAVGRVFKRICREGWLGKVLLSGFIHDELFGEVSNDINPGVFLKVLREEFEVKITNEDGTPWCPLYMGFGYGMSWYEAKSVELPIKLQWEIVENYGDNGFPNWAGDGRAFCDTIPDMLRDFEVRDISSQILSADAQGKEIKPALNSALLDCVKTDVTSYVEGISDFCQLDYLEVESIGFDAYLELYKEQLIKHLDTSIHIQNVLVDEHNIIHGDFTRMPFESARFIIEEKDDKVKISYKGSETQGALDLFCMLHNIDRSKVNLLDIAEYDASASNNMATGTLLLEDDEELDERGKERLIDSRIETLGMYLDVDNGMILLQFVPEPYLGLIRSSCNAEGRGYKVRFHDLKAQKKYDCQAWISSDKVNYIQQVYLQYFKAQRR